MELGEDSSDAMLIVADSMQSTGASDTATATDILVNGHIPTCNSGAGAMVLRLLFYPTVDLSARAFVQPLGSEDEWEELGAGGVDITPQNSLRVVAAVPERGGATLDGDAVSPVVTMSTSDGGLLDDRESALAVGPPPQPFRLRVLLEDFVSEDTVMEATDLSIVWNSTLHSVSYCVMFNDMSGFRVIWSAIHQLLGRACFAREVASARLPQRQQGGRGEASPEPRDDAPCTSDNTVVPPLAHDFLSAFAEMGRAGASPAIFDKATSMKVGKAFHQALKYVGAMGFLYRHCVAFSFIANRYGALADWALADVDVARALLHLFHPGLVLNLVDDDESFRRLCDVADALSHITPQSPVGPAGAAAAAKPFRLPPFLAATPNGAAITFHMNRVQRLSLLRFSPLVLCGEGDPSGLLAFLDALIQSEVHAALQGATHPQVLNSTVAVIGRDGVSWGDAAVALRCIADVAALASSTMPREEMSGVVSRIEDAGLVSAIESLTHRLILPAARAALAGSARGTPAPSDVGPLLAALCHVLDALAVAPNNKAEEGLVSSLWRRPLLQLAAMPAAAAASGSLLDPDAACPPCSALLELLAAWPSVVQALRVGAFVTPNQGAFALYHIAGLHDDEGTSVDRDTDAAVTRLRQRFQAHVASAVLARMVSRHVGSPAPSGPSSPPALAKTQSGSAAVVGLGTKGAAASAPPAPLPPLAVAELTLIEFLLMRGTYAVSDIGVRVLLLTPRSRFLGELASAAAPLTMAARVAAAPPPRVASAGSSKATACAALRLLREVCRAIDVFSVAPDAEVVAAETELDRAVIHGCASDLERPADAAQALARLPSAVRRLHVPTSSLTEVERAGMTAAMLRGATFELDVFAPALNAAVAAAKGRRARAPAMFVSTLWGVFDDMKAHNALAPLRRFIRIRHGAALPPPLVAAWTAAEEREIAEALDTAVAAAALGGSPARTPAPSRRRPSHAGALDVSMGMSFASPGRGLVVDMEVPPPLTPEQLQQRARSPAMQWATSAAADDGGRQSPQPVAASSVGRFASVSTRGGSKGGAAGPTPIPPPVPKTQARDSTARMSSADKLRAAVAPPDSPYAPMPPAKPAPPSGSRGASSGRRRAAASAPSGAAPDPSGRVGGTTASTGGRPSSSHGRSSSNLGRTH